MFHRYQSRDLSQKLNPICHATMRCRFDPVRISYLFIRFIHFISTAPSSATSDSEPFRNALVRMRSQKVELGNGLGTSLLWVQISSKWSAVSSLYFYSWIHDFFHHFESISCNLLLFSNFEKSFSSFVSVIFIVSAREWALWRTHLTDYALMFSVLWGKKWMRKYFVPTKVGLFSFNLLW